MNHYEMRLEQRRERLLRASGKARQESEAREKAARAMLDMIPPGQPILVGHHSERGHRAHLRKIDRNFDKAIQADKSAHELARRADAVGTAGISSDDPDAVKKLREELARCEAAQAQMKAANAALRKAGAAGKDAQIAALVELGFPQDKAERLVNPQFAYMGQGFPGYRLTNNNANMRRIKIRIQQLEAARTLAGRKPEIEQHGDVALVRDVEDNRIRLQFPGKPDEPTRSLLKGCGFRWSPMAKAWQRQLNTAGEWAAKRVLDALAREVVAASPVAVVSPEIADAFGMRDLPNVLVADGAQAVHP